MDHPAKKGKAKLRGFASRVGGMLRGRVGILATLEKEHTEVDTLLADVAESTDLETRFDLYREARRGLLVHAKAEELELYPVCRERAELAGLIEQSLLDHARIESSLLELQSLPIGATAWMMCLESLRAEVQAHVHVEENEVFTVMAEIFDPHRLREMDRAYKACRKRLEAVADDLIGREPPPDPVARA